MIKKVLKDVSSKIDRKRYKNREFVIVANNCWGAEIYKRLEVKYNTPFVGLFFYGPDYIKLLERFDYYLSLEVTYTNTSKWLNPPPEYPIGKLDDIEIHFMHYANEEEATSKWNRRLSRMNEVKNRDNYYFKFCDRDNATIDHINRFHELPYKNKISFGHDTIYNKSHITIREKKYKENIPTGVNLYRLTYKYVNILKWVDSGVINRDWLSRLKFFLRAV